MVARKLVFGTVFLLLIALWGVYASLAQVYSCYSVYLYEGYCYCMVNQQSGWATCRHLAPGTCELEGQCGPGGGGVFP
jgi:hypothetical protein